MGSTKKAFLRSIEPKKTVLMPFGRYRGVDVKKIPNSYLRWMLTIPGIPDVVREEAQEKLNASDFDDTDIQISRHALDMFSKRFLDKWTDRNIGLGTFVAHMAIDALNRGRVIKDERNMGKGLNIFFDDVIWVFSWPPEAPDYKSLITVMPPNNKIRKMILQDRQQPDFTT